MPCGPDTKDPIADALFKADGLMLLGRGFHPGELEAGDVARQPARETAREVVLDKAARIFSGMRLKRNSLPYERLGRNVKTRLLNLSTAAELSPTFTGAPGQAEVEAALSATGSENFEVCFVGAHMSSLDLAKLEAHLSTTELTELGARYINEGQRLFLVSDVLSVSGAVLKLDVADRRDAKLGAMQQNLGKLGLRGSVDLEEAASIKFEPVADNVAIAVRLVEVVFSAAERLELRGVRRSKTIRSGEPSLEVALGTAEALGVAGPFLHLPK